MTVNLAVGFAERGFPVDMVLAAAEGPFLSHLPSNVRIVDLKSASVLRSLAPLAAYLRRERPAALLSALNHANVVAMTAGLAARVNTRIVVTLHSTPSKELETFSDIRTKGILTLLGRLQRLAAAIVAVSHGVADDAARTLSIPRHRLTVIYNPVVTPSLRIRAAAPPPHPWFSDSGAPIVLGVGRLTPEKNFTALIDAFAMVLREQPARLVILGDGPERPRLTSRIRELSLEHKAALPGFVDNPYPCISRAGALVLSSRYEGLPTTIIESLALGTPVVSCDCPSGPREILQDGVLGALVPPDDVPALARAISRALVTPRSTPPWEALQAFTPEVVLSKYEQVLTPWAS